MKKTDNLCQLLAIGKNRAADIGFLIYLLEINSSKNLP